MAGPHTFIGGVDGDFGVAGNFDTNLVPATGENWGVNHLTQRSIDAGLDQSAKTFPLVSVAPGFIGKKIGVSAADPFKCGITKLQVTGSPLAIFHQGACTDVISDQAALADEGLLLDGAILRLNVLAGRVRLDGSAVQPAGSVFFVGAEGDSDDDLEGSQLRIDSTVDLVTNDTKIVQRSGRVQCGASVDDVLQAGGEFNLGAVGDAGSETMSTAAMLLLWMTGGTFRWKGDGTITAAHVAGGAFGSDDYDLAKTLTNMTTYGRGRASFRKGHNVTFTNPIRVLGRFEPEYPLGHTLTVA